VPLKKLHYYDIDSRPKSIYSYRMASSKPPIIPDNTCPYIDMAQDLISQMSAQEDAEWRKKQADLAESLLEYIRAANLELREGGKYWYNRAKKVGKGTV
jgi:hypothetical protein